MAVENKWVKRFHHKAMQNFLKYLQTQNLETQAVVNSTGNLASTGTKSCMINGVFVPALAADSSYAPGSEAAYAAWASGASYVTNGPLSEVVDADGKHWVCIKAHTSAAANHPWVDGGEYWKRLDVWAEDAAGNSIAQDKKAWYLICAMNDGTLRAFIAYEKGTESATTALRIPAFDPERYVAVALLAVVPTSGAHVLGTTTLATVGTFTQILGPVFPDADLLDRN
jgi:hypothetical protein